MSNTDTVARYVRLRYEVARLLSGDNPLFRNYIYKDCLVEAMLSNCQKSRFGCVVKDEGCIGTRGHNMVMECNKDWTEPECVRIHIPSRTESMIGCCAHAEEIALVQAIELGMKLADYDFYVAGFASNGMTIIPTEKRFSCLRCATQMYLHGVGRLLIPCKDRWESLTMDEAIQSAKQYATGEKKI